MASNSKTILVSDADPNVLNTLETALLCEGFRVVTAQDGIEAVKLVQESGPIAAAILDLGLPQKDGLTALRELRRSVADLPVVILSESSQPATIIEAMRAGAADYLMKSVAQQDLLAVVNRVTARDSEKEIVARGLACVGRADRLLALHQAHRAARPGAARSGHDGNA